MTNTQLNQIFNIVPSEDESNNYPIPIVITPDEAVSNPLIDFGIARDNLTVALRVGTEALQAAAIIAGSAQTPEHFMAVASLLNSITKASQGLVSNVKDVSAIGKNNSPQELHNHVHFSGSTEELSRMLKGNK